MTASPHDHSRPGRGAQLATMRLLRAILADDRTAIRRAAVAGGCPACTAVAVAAYGLVPGWGTNPRRTTVKRCSREVLAAWWQYGPLGSLGPVVQSGRARRPVKAEVAGSNPVRSAASARPPTGAAGPGYPVG